MLQKLSNIGLDTTVAITMIAIVELWLWYMVYDRGITIAVNASRSPYLRAFFAKIKIFAHPFLPQMPV